MSIDANQAVPTKGAKVKCLPPREFLEQCFEYNPDTGELKWKKRPLDHFPSQKGWSCFNSSFCGKKAGCLHSGGYLCVRLYFNGKNSLHFVHRIILVLKGFVLSETDMVDHINRNRSDNRLSNLRIADAHQNASNSCLSGGKKPINGHLPRGVVPSTSFGKFTSRIRHRGRCISLGVFLTPEDARAAYVAKAKELRGEFTVD